MRWCAPKDAAGSPRTSHLVKKRIKRRAVLETPHFMSLPFILARTDLIATVPHAIGFAYVSEHASITLVEPPPAAAALRFAAALASQVS